ncbi:hypothetical protein [Sphaerisporangium sp. NPDC051011]|uniref:hypothetical protein n=1 Tax=Sphaerisporangium sp. NPDC051011 TaxID=3155792 RepID=UPI0033F36ACF
MREFIVRDKVEFDLRAEGGNYVIRRTDPAEAHFSRLRVATEGFFAGDQGVRS